MMPLKYSNFPVAPCFIHYFLWLQFLLLFHYSAAGKWWGQPKFFAGILDQFSTGSSCKMCFQLSDYMSLNMLTLYDWEQYYSFCSFCFWRSLAFLDLGVLRFRKSGIVMCSCHMFPWSKHLITCVLANFKCSISVCCNCNLIYMHSNNKRVVTILFLSLA